MSDFSSYTQALRMKRPYLTSLGNLLYLHVKTSLQPMDNLCVSPEGGSWGDGEDVSSGLSGYPRDPTAEQEDRGSGDDEAVDPTLSFRSVTTTQTHCHEF